jgi:4-hydroxyacetophenone monooxygenase
VEPFEAYNAEIDDALSRTIWTHPGMTTYYRNAKGRIVTNTPWTNARWWHATIKPDLSEYDFS